MVLLTTNPPAIPAGIEKKALVQTFNSLDNCPFSSGSAPFSDTKGHPQQQAGPQREHEHELEQGLSSAQALLNPA